MANKQDVLQRARNIITDQSYVNRWFSSGSDSFFGEQYITPVLKGKYFITKDSFMSQTIYALREITPYGIETIGGPLESEQEARELMQ